MKDGEKPLGCPLHLMVKLLVIPALLGATRILVAPKLLVAIELCVIIWRGFAKGMLSREFVEAGFDVHGFQRLAISSLEKLPIIGERIRRAWCPSVDAVVRLHKCELVGVVDAAAALGELGLGCIWKALHLGDDVGSDVRWDLPENEHALAVPSFAGDELSLLQCFYCFSECHGVIWLA